MKRFSVTCASWEHRLQGKPLRYDHCGSEMEGFYRLPVLAELSAEEQAIICDFVKASGSLVKMGALRKVSCPT